MAIPSFHQQQIIRHGRNVTKKGQLYTKRFQPTINSALTESCSTITCTSNSVL